MSTSEVDSIKDEDYQATYISLCFALAGHIDYFVKVDKVEEFFNNFKEDTLKALSGFERASTKPH